MGVILAGTAITIWIHNLGEIAYWKYVDWKADNESR